MESFISSAESAEAPTFVNAMAGPTIAFIDPWSSAKADKTIPYNTRLVRSNQHTPGWAKRIAQRAERMAQSGGESRQ